MKEQKQDGGMKTRWRNRNKMKKQEQDGGIYTNTNKIRKYYTNQYA